MLRRYEQFIEFITQNPSDLSRWCTTKSVRCTDILPTLPLTIYQQIWKPILDSKGFSPALPQISNALFNFILEQDISSHQHDIARTHSYTLLHLAPQLLLYHFTHSSAQQLGQRIKQLRKNWALPHSACGVMIGALEAKQDKEKDSELKRQKVVSDMLILFDLSESKVDYSGLGMQLLNISIGEAVFYMLEPLTTHEDLYRIHLMRHRDKIAYFLSKIKGKELVWGTILAQIVLPHNNQTSVAKAKNVCILFLLTEVWDRFRDESSRLKDPAYMEVLAETFHRLLFHIYESQLASKLLLSFLHLSKFAYTEDLRRSIAYHLLALHKLKSGEGRNGVSKQIEMIWRQKLGETRINQMFLEHAPTFIANSQKSGERVLEQIESKSIRSSASKSSISSLDLRHLGTAKNRKSMRSTKINTLHNWVRNIEMETKKLNLEKIYLLMEGFKHFYRQQYAFGGSEDSPRSLVMGMAVNLIKKMESKLYYRYGKNALVKAIYLELAEVLEHNNCQGYAFQESVSSLGIFQYCFIENGYLNIDTLLKLHEKHNYEENIETLLTLKLLGNELASNNSSQNIRSDQFDESINKETFPSKIYELYKFDFMEKKLDARKLSVINRLIGLNSSNILHNLLANYVYTLFRQGLQDTAPYRKKTHLLSQILNAEIVQEGQSERKRILLLMGEIFDGFDARSKERTMNIVTTAPVSNRYFQYLKRKEHDAYLLTYSDAYFQLNYLKQAIYFLQLHHLRTKTLPLASATEKAIQLYSRLLPSFNKSQKYIRKRLDVQKEEKHLRDSKGSHRMAILLKNIGKLMSKIQGNINKYSGFIVNGKPKWEVWLGAHLVILWSLIRDIHKFREAQQVNESVLRASILLRILSFQLSCLSDSSQSSLESLIEGIQRLPNSSDQIVFYKYLLSHKSVPMIEAVEQLYLMKLLKTESDEQLLKHLRKDLKQGEANVMMSSYHLRYLIRYYFMRGELALAVSALNIYYERGESEQLGQLYQMELQCRFRMMLNYTLEDSLGFVKSKCLDDRVGQGQDSSFFFKIFRLIFNRYHFTRLLHNDLFLETFFKFIDRRQLFTRNQQDLSDAIFYLIRFVLEKFFYSPEARKYGAQIIAKFESCTKNIVPFCSYMIKRISSCAEKNQVIQSILVAVLAKHPQQCVWLISFLKNFSVLSKSNNNSEQEREATRLGVIYKKVKEELQVRKNVNKTHQIWIDQLIQISLLDTQKKTANLKNFKQLEIPSELHFVFSSQYYIHKLLDAKVLTNGKSSPLQLTFSLVHCKQKEYRPAKVIVKANVGCKKYRMESNTANFFQQIGLIDSDITYRISHLTKYLVVIEHVNNWGTINSIISTYFPHVKEQENAVIVQLAKRRSVNKDQRRLLDVYDRCSPKVNVPLSRLIYEESKNIRDWWNRNLNFIRTHAQWSFLGFIVGLGDRHTDNILMTEECKLIHIDFEYALDTGLKLPCPQWVPFRLTKCLTEPLGMLNVEGLFFAQMVSAAEQLQHREADFWRAISHFVGSLDTNITEEILCRSKLESEGKNCRQQGVFNLIQAAKNPELLRLMFEGWRAYL